MLVIDKIKCDVIQHSLHNPDILVLSGNVHIEMADIFHSVLPLLLHAGVFRKNNADIVFCLVKFFGK